jgi:hypothetical protein
VSLVVPANALADIPPTQVAPGDGASLTARVDQVTFQAQASALPTIPPSFPGRMHFYVSEDQAVDSEGVLSNYFTIAHADSDTGLPPTYQVTPTATWTKTPSTYYWQAVFAFCEPPIPPDTLPDSDCQNESPVRSLVVQPQAAPAQLSPSNVATIPFGARPIFTVRGADSDSQGSTRLLIEFARNPALAADGTFSRPLLSARPTAVGENRFQHRLGAQAPGTYHWIVQRFDNLAEPDGIVTSQVRSFTVAEPPAGTVPNTLLTHHPGRRTHRRKVRFRFRSDAPGSGFQCFYTGGWTRCDSPEVFRRLKPGRYRFKVRAVLSGKPDPTPAKWLFKIVRRHNRR